MEARRVPSVGGSRPRAAAVGQVSAFFRALSVFRTARSLRSPHTALARQARKTVYKVVNRKVR